ncbi:MAG: hypothetical protein R3B70_46610 [Polyangiaceae bacterium]
MLHRFRSLGALSLVSVVVALSGCAPEDSDTGPGTTTTQAGPCEAMRETCFSKQMVCVEASAGPVCEACGAGKYASAQGACEAIPGTGMTHTFEDFTTPAGGEVKGLCQSWTLNNAEELWVNAVELTQNASSHHSNWTFVPDDKFEGPDGVWPCKERGYSQLEAALYGGVVYAQSTQASHEVQKFPNGAAVRISPYARIIGDVHLLNTTSEDITGHSELTLYVLPVEEVEIKLAPFHLSYEGLNIPPHSDSRFTGKAALDGKFSALGLPFEMDIYFVLPHYHALGKSFFLDMMGGEHDGERVFEVGAFDAEAHGKAYDPPISVKDAEGFSFGCDFTNPRDEYIKYGLGDQEMCEMLGFADSKAAFESIVHEANPDGTDGSVQLFTGDATTLAFKWTNDQASGKGP